jgi:hypothetical protein
VPRTAEPNFLIVATGMSRAENVQAPVTHAAAPAETEWDEGQTQR